MYYSLAADSDIMGTPGSKYIQFTVYIYIYTYNYVLSKYIHVYDKFNDK